MYIELIKEQINIINNNHINCTIIKINKRLKTYNL